MNFADTNWLAAAYIEPHADDAEAMRRREIVDRFLRRHGGQLIVSHVILFGARKIFPWSPTKRKPSEWQLLEADFDGRLHVDPMNRDVLRQECHNRLRLFQNPVAADDSPNHSSS